MIDLAPGWRLRCPKCGRTRPYREVGIRLGAASFGKRILGWCTGCRWLRWGIVERVPEGADGGTAAPGSQGRDSGRSSPRSRSTC